MDGLAMAAGASAVVELGGRRYKMRAPGIGFFAELEMHLLTQRRSYVAIMREGVEGLDEPLQERLLLKALENEGQRQCFLPTDDVTDFMQSFSGMRHTVAGWLTYSCPAEPEHELLEAVSGADMEKLLELVTLLMQMSGADRLGNRIGPSSKEPGPTTTSSQQDNGRDQATAVLVTAPPGD